LFSRSGFRLLKTLALWNLQSFMKKTKDFNV
jgi:hypothetical protein